MTRAQGDLQRSLEQAQHIAQHLQNQQAAVFAERAHLGGSARPVAGQVPPPLSVLPQPSADQSSGEQRDKQDVDSWRHAVESALQSMLDLFDADRTVCCSEFLLASPLMSADRPL